jgi:hypothetical protein
MPGWRQRQCTGGIVTITAITVGTAGTIAITIITVTGTAGEVRQPDADVAQARVIAGLFRFEGPP